VDKNKITNNKNKITNNIYKWRVQEKKRKKKRVKAENKEAVNQIS
jgi:hypothetical protein